MAQIGYIAPNEYLGKIAEYAIKEHQLDIDVEVGSMETGVKKAEILKNKGVKVFISRGGTALRIREKLDVPVIEVQITNTDIAKAISAASKLGKRIAVIGFYNLLEGLEAFSPLLNLEIKQIYIKNVDEAFAKVAEAKREGADVIIGGVVQCEFAEKLQLKSVFLESGPSAVYRSYKQAEMVLNTLLYEQSRNQEIRAILDYAREGFLVIDKQEKITLINPAAAKLISCKENVIGKPLKDVCRNLTNLRDVLSTEKEYLQDITSVGATTILYNRRPILLDGKVIGAMATLQDINTVQEAESKIRRKIHTAGLYARYTLDNIDGNSSETKKTKEIANRFAKTDSTILITGESGTGKEMFAQGIHNASRRSSGPFVAINCASLPESILESELFGYVEGAFTGARKQGKLGLFELAHEGTIFLDEISEMPLALQGRLLRVLQERMVMRLGDDKVTPINVRVIAASNRDLVNMINDGKFREDLYFRINILRLPLAPLRDRVEDIPIIANKFISEYRAEFETPSLEFSANGLKLLMDYYWPGNIRELRNLVERLATISDSPVIDEKLIREFLYENKSLFKENIKPNNLSYDEVQRVLSSVSNNKTKAAEILGVHRSTIWRILKNEEK